VSENFYYLNTTFNLYLNREIERITENLNKKNFKKAEQDSKRLLKEFPKHFAVNNLLGLCFYYQNKMNDSELYFSKAIKEEKKFEDGYKNLGIVYKRTGKIIKAKNIFEQLLLINPKSINGLINLADIFQELNQIEKAINFYKKVLEIDKTSYLIFFKIGVCLQSLGKFDEATNYFNKSMELNKAFTQPEYNISLSSKYKSENDSHFKRLKEKDSIISNNLREKVPIYYSLGKAYEDIKKTDKAFQFFNKAASLEKKFINYDFDHEKKLFKNIKTFFNKKEIAYINSKEKSNVIFILGMPRSGTTLVEQIISSHDDVYGAGELPDVMNIFLTHFFDRKKRVFLLSNKQLNDKKFLKKIRQEYFDSIGRFFSDEKKILIDKSPFNFKFIGLIKLILPNAKIIQCERNSIDNCLSIYKSNIASAASNFKYDFKQLAEYYKSYLDLMNFWKKKFPDFIYKLSYEKLVQNQKDETKKVLKFCNLSLNKKCFKFEKNVKFIKTASLFQARKPVYQTSINSWKKYEKHLSPLIELLQSK